MTIRLIIRIEDNKSSDGSARKMYRTFDIDAPEAEACLALADKHNLHAQIDGFEIISKTKGPATRDPILGYSG